MADTQRILTCPACDKEMAKIYMEEAGVNVDICIDGCGGILFNNRELEKFDEQHENADKIFEAYEGKNFKSVHEEEIRICPVCNTPMIKQGAGVGNIVIDVCNYCGAKFLDYGELEKIRFLKGNDNAHREKVNSIVDAVVKDKETIPGGPVGTLAHKYGKSTDLRATIERFICHYLENKPS